MTAGGTSVAVVGAGPAGLMAAEVLRANGVRVDVYDAMPSPGRKFLLAGIGGLNLTHDEPREDFIARFADRSAEVRAWLDGGLDAEGVRAWAATLGIKTFVGSSRRVFPTDMKAAPLLRAWLQKLRSDEPGRPGVRFHTRHRWMGWNEDGTALRMLRRARSESEVDVETLVKADAAILALGGASWPRLGSDGAWAPWLAERGVDVAPLQASNCGFDVAPTGPDREGWSEHLRTRCAGEPLKAVALLFTDAEGQVHRQVGECVLTATGLEGSLVYAFSARLRDAIARDGRVLVHLDLLPQKSADDVGREVAHPRGPRSLATHLKSRLGLHGAKVALLHEVLTPAQCADSGLLASTIKALPVTLAAPRPVFEAISTAGGVRFEAMDARQMLRAVPGVFCAGEMVDWEAPTGGYLLTACLASGRAAGEGAVAWLRDRGAASPAA